MLFGFAFLWVLASAEGDAVVKRAANLTSLDDFLESYMGECQKGDPIQNKECQEASKRFRAANHDKTFVVEVPSRLAQKLTPVPSKIPDVLLYEYTPFFDAAGFGLTFQKPFNQGGAPAVRREKLKIPAPPNDEDSPILEAAKVDRLIVQLVFKPNDTWKLAKKGGGFWQGLQVHPLLLRLQDARSGEVADTLY